MKHKAVLLASIVFILVVFAISVYAQAQWGCCCDPTTHVGSFESQTSCLQKNFTFVGPPPNISTTCYAMCNVTPVPVPPPPGPVPTQCGAVNFRPPPTNVVARALQGEKAIKIDFNIPCPSDYMTIYRCTSQACTDIQDISGRISPSNTYTDNTPDLEWDTDYTYQIVAHYNVAGDSQPASITANAGNVECWQQRPRYVFCISRAFYNQQHVKDYLQAYGYKALATGYDFTSNFDYEVGRIFNERLEKNFFCNDVNILSRPTPAVSCSAPEICVADGTKAECMERIPCDIGGIFGLYPAQAACEGTVNNLKYCFLDRSATAVDKCYQCHPEMKCYDYHSKNACNSDNCGVGQCAWKDVFPLLGIGVCYDTRYDACAVCTQKYTVNAKNKEGYNDVFDKCTEEKSKALSTTDNPCFYDKDTNLGDSCDTADCTSFSEAQCGSPTSGIELNPDNSIKTKSNDPCDIDVCQFSSATGCLKNADGNTGPGWQDCFGAPDPVLCEQDYFPPNTFPYVSGLTAGKHDFINIVIKDKLNKSSPAVDMQGTPGYTTYFCIQNNLSTCSAASQFTIRANSTQLNINDLKLQDGQRVIGQLSFGTNVLKYYSVDMHKNKEVLGKSMTVFACDQCSGPKVLNITVTNGRKVDDKYYTNSLQPTITVTFNEPAQLTASSLTRNTTSIPVSVAPSSGHNLAYTFTLSSPLTEGNYVFAINSVDDQSVYMDVPLAMDLIIDTTPPTVTVTPPDKTEFDTNTVAVALDFNEPVLLTNTTFDEEVFVDQYIKKKFPINLVSKLTTTDDMGFSASLANLREGLKVMNINAVDYASNPVSRKSTFSVITAAPKIRIKDPSWGVSSAYNFDITFETSSVADCRYIYDVPTPPPADEFEDLAEFDYTDGIEHKIAGFNRIPFGDPISHPIYVYCKTEDFGIRQETFNLSVDADAPLIVSYYAHPNPIVEQFVFNTSRYVTKLNAQTNKLSFCKYSASKQNFDEMEGVFPGFDESPKKSHSAEIEVNEVKAYTYYVACKSLAELASPTVMINFDIDLSVQFKVNNTTPRYSKTTLFFLRVETNKRAWCYFGENPNATNTCFGNCSFTQGHVQQIIKPAGTHKFYVKCNRGAGAEISDVIPINVTVDTTPPFMLWVNDSSTLPGQPDVSWYSGKLRLRFLGDDNESKVIKYYYLLETAFARELVVNWTPSLELNASPIYVKVNLTDGTRYIFRVKPVNILELEGEYASSDGVTVDFTKAPPECSNGELDSGETDVDCGGMCDGCANGKKCEEHGDCDSLYCVDGLCTAARCDDAVRNGKETDADCGGSDCDGCELEMLCAEDSDCKSNKCKYGACAIPDPCENSQLDGTESDIDCGGSCPERCSTGQNCNSADDCSVGLNCVSNTCGMPRDIDGDGVLDDVDDCLDTPAGEEVDETGCSLSQKHSCDDDIDDAWRSRYFGSVLCDGDGAFDADPDDDGLTNMQEYRSRTYPVDDDTDGDGWSDGVEIEKGTDPLDDQDHPKSLFWTFFWILLILAILAGAGVGGYYGYKKGYFDTIIAKFKKKAPEEMLPEEKPAEKPKPKVPVKPKEPEKISALRKLVKKKEEAKEEFVSLAEIGKPKAPAPVEKKPPEALARLKELKKKPGAKLPVKKPAVTPKAKEDALAKLKKMKGKMPVSKGKSEDALAKLKKLKKGKK